MKVGHFFKDDGSCEFVLWAPHKKHVQLKIVSPSSQLHAMTRDNEGYWHVTVDGVTADAEYFYVLDAEKECPDPASFYQPKGVNEPSGIVRHQRFLWNDHDWRNLPLEETVIYEVHVGTFTPEGTFDGVIGRLDYLKDLGVNAIEIMPVAQFPGGRNWGYDGVHPFAAQNTYGGPDGLKRLVNACHAKGMAVVLDVVYNHLGPEGNYLGQFAPYFTDRYRTPWGQAVNFDGPDSDGVRNFFIENVLYWFEHYHIDALRLDAVHGIFDFGAKHILREMKERVVEFAGTKGRPFHLIAESDLDDVRIVEDAERGGHGLDGQWLDDFHHALRTLITGEVKGYYEDFGRPEQLAKALREGFVFSWDYSRHRRRHFGSASTGVSPSRFVVFTQNHDQVGNRMLGERLGQLVDLESQKLAAGLMILSPYIPMLFMGEEFAADTPFLYFISHMDPGLIEAVRQGRKKEFAAFQWQGEPPDPQAKETFQRSRLDWGCLERDPHRRMLEFYRHVIGLRKTHPAWRCRSRKGLTVECDAAQKLIVQRRTNDGASIIGLYNFSDKVSSWTSDQKLLTRFLDSCDGRWGGEGVRSSETIRQGDVVSISPHGLLLYENRGIS